MEFFIIDNNGQQAGPFSMDQLVQKGISPETLVWKQGMADWTPAWKVEDLRAVLEAVEADKVNQNSNQNQGFNQNHGFNQNQGFNPNFNQNQGFNQNHGFNQSQGGNQNSNQDFNQNQGFQQGFQQGASMNQGFNTTQNTNQGFNPNSNQGFNQNTNQEFNQNPNFDSKQPKKKSNHFTMKMIIGLIIFIFAIFAVTNPSEEEHKEKVRTEVSKAIEKAVNTTDNNFFTQALRSAAKMMADNVMGEAMNQLFEYHNYIVCSKGSVEFNGKQHTISFGILGKVYTMNADDMVKALENTDNLQIEESSSTSDDNTIGDNSAASSSSSDSNADLDENGNPVDESGDGSISSRVQKKLEDKANEAMDKAADKVQKKLEEKINQQLDQATDSSKIEKIINTILELI